MGQPGTYKAFYRDGPAASDASCIFNIVLDGGEDVWTQEGLNSLFQELLDTLSANPKFEFMSASWYASTYSTVTPTPPEEPAPEG